MSRAGRKMAGVMASHVMRNSPSVTKSAGTHAALVNVFSGNGTAEILAGAVRDKKATIKANAALLKHYRREDKLSRSAVEIMRRALAVDEMALSRAESMSADVPYSEIQRKAQEIVRRQVVADATPFVLARIDSALQSMN